MASAGPLNIQTLEGSPIIVGSRTLVPQARLLSFGRHRASVAKGGIEGKGWAFGLLVPSALLEHQGGPDRSPYSLRRIPVPDATTRCLFTMGALAMTVALLCALVNRQLSSPSHAAVGG